MTSLATYDHATLEPLRLAHHQEAVRRLQAAMQTSDLDALIVLRKDFFNWINAHPSCFLESGMQGMSMIVLPRSGQPVGICSDHEIEAMTVNGAVTDWRVFALWSGHESRYRTGASLRYATQAQTLTPEGASVQMMALQSVLAELGLTDGKLGIEEGELKVSVMRGLQSSLPKADFRDSTALFMQAWIQKTPYEVYNLRYAAHHQWRVTHEVMRSIRPGDTYADIRQRIEIGAAQTPDIDKIFFLMLYMGPSASATERYFHRTAEAGQFISIDLGFSCRGYVSDSGRAYFLGQPTPQQARIAEIYHEAHETVKKGMVPGANVGELYDTAAEMVRRHGLSDFRRGHIGHGLGCSAYMEETPFLAHGSPAVLQAGMVVTLEVPFYGPGLGAYFEEDILLITENGNESLTEPAFGLHVIPC